MLHSTGHYVELFTVDARYDRDDASSFNMADSEATGLYRTIQDEDDYSVCTRGCDIFGRYSRIVKTKIDNNEHVRGEEEVPVGVTNQLAREGGTVEKEPESVGIHGEG